MPCLIDTEAVSICLSTLPASYTDECQRGMRKGKGLAGTLICEPFYYLSNDQKGKHIIIGLN